MSKHRFLTVAASILCACAGTQSAMAELPSLTVKDWLGRFAVAESGKFVFTVQTDGAIGLIPVAGKKDSGIFKKGIAIRPRIEETMQDGSVVARQIDANSLESNEPATDKLEKTTIRGKVTGDTTFEITAEVKQGTVYFGGKIIAPGPEVKNPLRFCVELYFPSAYPTTKLEDEKQMEKFQKQLEDDKITIKWTDGKKVKQTYEENVDASSDKFNGPGIASAEVDTASFYGKKITVTAAPNSFFKMTNSNSEPLHKGFSLLWAPDAAKDIGNKAKLAIEVR